MGTRTRTRETRPAPHCSDVTRHTRARFTATPPHQRLSPIAITALALLLHHLTAPHAHPIANTIMREIYLEPIARFFLHNGFRLAYGATLELHRSILTALPALILLSGAILTSLHQSMSTNTNTRPTWRLRDHLPTPRTSLTITYALAPLYLPNALAYGINAQWRQHLTPYTSLLPHLALALTLLLAIPITLGLYEHLYRPHGGLEASLRRGARLALNYPRHTLRLALELALTITLSALTLGIAAYWLAPRWLFLSACTYRHTATHASAQQESAPRIMTTGGAPVNHEGVQPSCAHASTTQHHTRTGEPA